MPGVKGGVVERESLFRLCSKLRSKLLSYAELEFRGPVGGLKPLRGLGASFCVGVQRVLEEALA